MITQNEKKQLNQIKGRDMIAKFTDNSVQNVDVNGNGESVYFVLDSLDFIGMNKVECSDMVLRFADSNQLSTITFIRDPIARFVPPHEIEEPDTKLPGFAWRLDEKPGRGFVDSILIKSGIRPKGQMLVEQPVQLFWDGNQLTLYSADADSSLTEHPFFIRLIANAAQTFAEEMTIKAPSKIDPIIFELSNADFQSSVLWKTIPLPDQEFSSLIIGQSKELYQEGKTPEVIWHKEATMVRSLPTAPSEKAIAPLQGPVMKKGMMQQRKGKKASDATLLNKKRKAVAPIGK
jgi:hypothetical protein